MGRTIESFEPLALASFDKISEWTSLASFCIVGIKITSEKVKENVRQSLLENSSLNHSNSFVTEYAENGTRLWL